MIVSCPNRVLRKTAGKRQMVSASKIIVCSEEAVEIIGAGHRLWCHVVLLLSLAGCDTKTARQAGR